MFYNFHFKSLQKSISREALEEYFTYLKFKLRQEVLAFGKPITLTIVVSTDDEASKSYIRNKTRIAESVGIDVNILSIKGLIPMEEEEEIKKQEWKYISGELRGGMIIQLPASTHATQCAKWLRCQVDADCLGEEAYSNFIQNPRTALAPCTANAIIRHMQYILPESAYVHKTAFILGRSKLVGEPLMILLRDKMNMTVIQAHSKSFPGDIERFMQQADVVCLASNKPHSIYEWNIHNDTLCYDITIGRENNKLCGAMRETDKEGKIITPTPGGVGPMTCYELMFNTVELAKRQLPF